MVLLVRELVEILHALIVVEQHALPIVVMPIVLLHVGLVAIVLVERLLVLIVVEVLAL